MYIYILGAELFYEYYSNMDPCERAAGNEMGLCTRVPHLLITE